MQSGIERFHMWFAATCITLLCASGAAAEKRVALVIGNGAYSEAPLRNPVNDARSMGAKLAQLGFKVILRENLTKLEMERAAFEFGEQLNADSVGLVFYAGHGLQVGGNNYLVPVDARISAEHRVRWEAFDINRVLNEMEAAGSQVNIVILDACRNNPFERRFRSVEGGLAQISAPKGTLIAYATGPNRTAADGTGANGLYTAELVRAIDTPGIVVEEVFKRVRVEVGRVSNGSQTPWEVSSLTGAFYFRPPSVVQPNAVTGATSSGVEKIPAGAGNSIDREALFWQTIKDSKDPQDFVAYLGQFPNGDFVGLAKNRVQALSGPKQVAAAPPTQMANAPSAPAVSQMKVGTVFRDCPQCPELVVIPTGRFLMGTAKSEIDRDISEGPQHQVNVRSFAMGRYEVTFADWDACTTAGGCTSIVRDQGWGRERRPVFNVSWSDAQQYARWLSSQTGAHYRLPSEAEWEYAARGGTTTRRYWGDAIGRGHANCFDCGYEEKRTAPVGSFSPNPFGLYDMIGNVTEWTEDCWNENYDGAPTDGSAWILGDCTSRVARGGSWRSNAQFSWQHERSNKRDLRAGHRGQVDKGFRTDSLGFRVARTL